MVMRIPCFDSCQLITTRISNINDVKLTRMIRYGRPNGRHVARCRTYGGRTRPRTMPLAMMTMKNQIHGFPISVYAQEHHFLALRAAGNSATTLLN